MLAFVEPSALNRRLISFQRFAWKYPEWWSLALSAIAWLCLVRLIHPIGEELEHTHYQAVGSSIGQPIAGVASSRWTFEIIRWMLMVVAMMVPLVAASVHTAATRSLWRRRHHAIAGFLIGYLSPWLAFGLLVPVVLLVREVSSPLPAPLLTSVGLAVAAIWQLTPAKRRALLACHRTAPLAPTGWRADLDCVRYGWSIGTRCVVSCWALMLACVLATHSVGVMASTAAVGIGERYIIALDERVMAGLLSALALLYATGVAVETFAR